MHRSVAHFDHEALHKIAFPLPASRLLTKRTLGVKISHPLASFPVRFRRPPSATVSAPSPEISEAFLDVAFRCQPAMSPKGPNASPSSQAQSSIRRSMESSSLQTLGGRKASSRPVSAPVDQPVTSPGKVAELFGQAHGRAEYDEPTGGRELTIQAPETDAAGWLQDDPKSLPGDESPNPGKDGIAGAPGEYMVGRGAASGPVADGDSAGEAKADPPDISATQSPSLPSSEALDQPAPQVMAGQLAAREVEAVRDLLAESLATAGSGPPRENPSPSSPLRHTTAEGTHNERLAASEPNSRPNTAGVPGEAMRAQSAQSKTVTPPLTLLPWCSLPCSLAAQSPSALTLAIRPCLSAPSGSHPRYRR